MNRRFLLLFFLSMAARTATAGVILQGFYWDAPSSWDASWWDRLAGQSYDLAHSGFTAVWLPPVLKGAAGGYSNGYDTFDDYDLGSKDQRSTVATRWGTREQLTRAVAMFRANGMDVYFDNVLAHRSGDDGYGNFRYRSAWGNDQGGRFQKSAWDFAGFNIFGRQVNFGQDYMRAQLIQAGDWLFNALGVQGVRVDMATHVDPDFLRAYLGRGAMNGKFAVSEYWSENTDELQDYVSRRMQGRVSAFDFPLWGLLKDMANSGGYFDLRRLVGAGLAARLPDHAVTFVENHDTDRSYPIWRGKHLAYAYILTTEGYPAIFWKDYYDYGLRPALDALIWVHEKLAHGPLEWRHADEDLLVYERHGARGLLAGLNDNAVAERRQWVQTTFGGFVTLHDYTGHGPDLRTEADGRVEIRVPANSYVAYAPAGLDWPHYVPAYKVSQQFAGAADLDIPPAVRRDFQRAGRVWVEAGTWIDWDLYPGARGEGELDLMVIDPSNHLAQEQRTPLSWASQHGQHEARLTGWYEFKLKVAGSGGGAEDTPDAVPYWLNLSYKAPPRW